jgi:hypothetical protein
MSGINAQLLIDRDLSAAVAVSVDIESQVLTLTVGTRTLGSWLLSEIEVEVTDEGFLLKIGDERLELTTDDDDRFASLVGTLS